MAVLVGKKAPLFEADAVVNGGDFVEKFSLDAWKASVNKKLDIINHLYTFFTNPFLYNRFEPFH